MFWWLHAGSTYTGGTLNTTWASSSTTANRVAGISSFFDSTDREFFLTGVQFELGSQATPFEHRSFGEELLLCQRYYEDIDNAMYPNEHSGATIANYFWKVIKRAAPTLTAGTNAGSLTLNASNTGGGWVYSSSGAFNPVQNLRGDAEL